MRVPLRGAALCRVDMLRAAGLGTPVLWLTGGALALCVLFRAFSASLH